MCMALWAEQGREAFCSQGRNTGNMSRAACLRFLFSTKKNSQTVFFLTFLFYYWSITDLQY